MKMIEKTLVVISVIAVSISIYLTIVHYQPKALVCPDTGIISCETVLGSSYSTLAGIPIAVGGIVWFGANIVLARRKAGIVRNIWLILGLGGLVYSITAMGQIGKICIYCSTLDALIVVSIALFLLKRD
ncbi:MAG: vitamin K epoxide reductase family protein [Candidatus Micrarchaeota archaeon]|nr:vitamin K epoxide reductase family protein [Candidatus Micrarchaeota archaeon]